MLAQSSSHLLPKHAINNHPSPYRLYPECTVYQRQKPTLYSASALASVGAASVSLVSAGAALVSAAAGSASEEVQRVWKKSVSPIREIKQREHGSTAYQVISQELHDQCRVLVAFFAKGVEFCRITYQQIVLSD